MNIEFWNKIKLYNIKQIFENTKFKKKIHGWKNKSFKGLRGCIIKWLLKFWKAKECYQTWKLISGFCKLECFPFYH